MFFSSPSSWVFEPAGVYRSLEHKRHTGNGDKGGRLSALDQGRWCLDVFLHNMYNLSRAHAVHTKHIEDDVLQVFYVLIPISIIPTGH